MVTQTQKINKMKKIKFYNPLNSVIAELEITIEKYNTLCAIGFLPEYKWKEVDFSKCLIDLEASELI